MSLSEQANPRATPRKMKTDLELALECAINIYHQYAIKNPLDDYLSKSEFTQLMKETANTFLTNTVPPKTSIDAYINQLFDRADKNHDGRLKFTEFLTTLNLAAIDAHKRSHEPPRVHGPHPAGGHDHGHDHGHGPRN